MIKSPEQICLKDEALPLLYIGIDHFFESKQILLDTLISNQVNSPKAALTQQFFYLVTSAYNTSYGNSSL